MMKKCMEAVTRVEKGVYVSLWSTFWGEISTSTRTDNTDVFRKALVEYYGDEDDKLNVDDPDKALRCMVTGLRIPGEWITAAHLFPKKDKAKAHLIGIKDIDDPRNGMLWNRAIEEAFSLYQIVLSWDAEKNTYVLHIIDKNIFHEGLLMRKIKRPFNLSQAFFMDADAKTKFENLTFGDLDGQTIAFNNLNRPFKRILSLHGMLGVHKAKVEGKLPENFDLHKYHFDYWSQDSDTILLHQYLQDSLAWMEGAKDDKDPEFKITTDLEMISFHSGSV